MPGQTVPPPPHTPLSLPPLFPSLPPVCSILYIFHTVMYNLDQIILCIFYMYYCIDYHKTGSKQASGHIVFSDLFILKATYIRNSSSDLYKHEILLKITLIYVCHSLPDTGFPFLRSRDRKEIGEFFRE